MDKIHVENGKTKLNDDFFNQLQNNIEKAIEDSKKAENPVGHIRIETTDTNPAEYLGFGTWELWGKGKVPVGVDTDDTDFNTVEKTGGEKEHTLAINELPVNNITTTSSGAAADGYIMRGGYTPNGSYNFGGSGQAYNNMQPYITCYMWKRVA